MNANPSEPGDSTESDSSSMPNYKPSCYYFRRELRKARTILRAQQVGLAAVDELERLKAWVREQGLIPPKWRVLHEEIADYGWGENPPESDYDYA